MGKEILVRQVWSVYVFRCPCCEELQYLDEEHGVEEPFEGASRRVAHVDCETETCDTSLHVVFPIL